jgi:hypothetical protein
VLDPVLVEPGDGVDVVEALERAGGGHEGGVEGFDEGGGVRVCEELVDRFADLSPELIYFPSPQCKEGEN